MTGFQDMVQQRALSHIATNKVLKNTYLLLSMTLLFSAICSFFSIQFNLPMISPWITILVFYGLLFLIHKTANSPAGLAAVFGLTGWLGYTTGPIIGHYMATAHGTQLVTLALGGTSAIFVGLSAFVLLTKKDFSFLSNFIMVGVLVAIVCMVANLFLQIPALALALSAAFMFLSSAIILWQTSEIVNGGERNYILATVTLYVQIYNLFLSLLHLLSAFDD